MDFVKTVSMRIRGINEEGNEIANLQPQLERTFKSIGLTLKQDEDTFKSTYDIMNDLSKVWKDLTDFQRANIVELVAGKRQGNIVSAMLSQWGDSLRAYEVGLNSAGSATREFEKYQESAEYKINQFKNAIIGFWQSNLDTGTMKDFIDTGTELIKLLTRLTEIFGLLEPIMFAVTMGFLNLSKIGRGIRDWVADGIENLQKMNGKLTASSFSLTALGNAFDIAKVKAVGFQIAVSAGLAIALTTISHGIQKVISHFVDMKKKQEEVEKKTKEMVDSFNSHSKEIEKNIKRYKELDKIQDKTKQQKEEYIQVQNDLNKVLPILTKEIDKNGNAHLKSIDVIDSEIESLDKLNNKYNELTLENFTKNIRDTLDEIKKLNEEIANLEDAPDHLNTGIVGMTPKTDKQIIESEIKYLTIMRKKALLQQSFVNTTKEVYDAFASLNNVTDKLTESDKAFIDANIDKRALLIETEDDAVALASEMTTLAEDINKTRDAFGDLSDYFSTEEIKTIVDSGQVDNISNMISLAQQGSEEWSRFAVGLSETHFNAALLNKIIKLLNGNTDEGTGFIKGEYQALDQFKTTAKKTFDEMKLLNQAQEEMQNQGYLSQETLDKLIDTFSGFIDETDLSAEKIYEWIIANDDQKKKMVNNQIGMTKELIKQTKLRLGAMKAEISMLNNTQEVYSDLIKKNPDSANLQTWQRLAEINTPTKSAIQTEIDKLGELENELKYKTYTLKNLQRGDSSSKSSSNSTSKPSYQDITDAIIQSINAQVRLTDEKGKTLQKQIDEFKEQEKYNEAISKTNELIENQQTKIELLKQANEEFKKEADKVRGKYGFNTSNWFNDIGEATQEYLQQYNNASKSVQQSMEEEFNKLQKLQQAYSENSKEIDNVSSHLLELNANLNKLQFDNVTHQLDEMNEVLDDLDYKLQMSKSRMDLYNESSKEYRTELDLQVNLLKRKYSQTQKEINLINQQIQSERLSIQYKEQLQERLEDLTLSQLDYMNSIQDTRDKIRGMIVDVLQAQKTSYLDKLHDRQEDALESIENQIDHVTDKYDRQIEQQEEKLAKLDEELDKQDRLIQLKEIEEELDKVKKDKRFSYITAEGEEILTYDKAKVEEIQKNRDELIEQFRREDVRRSIQDEVDRLKRAKEDELEILNQSLENTRRYYDDLIRRAEDGWEDTIRAVQNGTDGYNALLNGEDGFYAQALAEMEIWGLGIEMQIENIKALFASLANLQIQMPQLPQMTGGLSDSFGGGGHSGDYADFVDDVTSYGRDENGVYHTEYNGGGAGWYDPNTGDFGYDFSDSTYHDGGIIGSKIANRHTELINKMFNTKPNEQIVKALKGELMIPPENISKNFIPNVKNLASSISGGVKNSIPQIVKQYNFKDLTIKSDNVTSFLDSIDFLITSEGK